jgi:hypothetical protein
VEIEWGGRDSVQMAGGRFSSKFEQCASRFVLRFGGEVAENGSALRPGGIGRRCFGFGDRRRRWWLAGALLGSVVARSRGQR